MGKQKWDLTSLNSLSSAAEWIRKGSDAELVLVIRKADAAFSIAPELQPLDAVTAVRDELPRLLQHLIDQRAKGAEKNRR